MHISLQHPQMKIHYELLQKWRNSMDLVGPNDIEEHFIDAYHITNNINATGNWADLGSGAGFPGIAFAIFNPNTQVTLVESRQKRAIFLRRIVATAKINNATIYHGRSEDLKNHSFQGIMSRAYKNPNAYLEDANRLLQDTGIALLLLGTEAHYIPPHPFSIQEERAYTLSDKTRKIQVLKKNSNTV